MAFRLGDDGTMDTVVVCEDCGAEQRYTFLDHDDDCQDESGDCECYDSFVEWALEDAECDCEDEE